MAADDPPLFAHWMTTWEDEILGYGAWEWLEGRERWIDFFVTTFNGQTNEARRVQLLGILAGFDDPSVARFFETQHHATLGHREALVVNAYRHLYGGMVDEPRIKQAIDVLARDTAHHHFLIDIAFRFRHPAFVPFLVSIVDVEPPPNSREAQWNAQEALERITFELQVSRKQGWDEWLARHGGVGRGAWLDRAHDSLRHRMSADEHAAAAFFEKNLHKWDDIALLPFVDRELTNRASFREHIARWVNTTYVPVYRSRLEPLARKLAPHAASLDSWTRDQLVALDLLPGRQQGTWADYVRKANSWI